MIQAATPRLLKEPPDECRNAAAHCWRRSATDRVTQGISSDFKPMNLIMNVADAKKTLAYAFQIVAAGNNVILDKEYSYIVNKTTGEKTTINVEHGEFNFDLWVPAPPAGQPPVTLKDGTCAALDLGENENGGLTKGFTRQEVPQ